MPLGGYTSGLHKTSMGTAVILVSKADESAREVAVYVEPQAETVDRPPYIVVHLSVPLCSDRLWRWLGYAKEKWGHIKERLNKLLRRDKWHKQ